MTLETQGAFEGYRRNVDCLIEGQICVSKQKTHCQNLPKEISNNKNIYSYFIFSYVELFVIIFAPAIPKYSILIIQCIFLTVRNKNMFFYETISCVYPWISVSTEKYANCIPKINYNTDLNKGQIFLTDLWLVLFLAVCVSILMKQYKKLCAY